MRVVISGETGAGKTTLVRALTNVLPVDTRIVVIEDTRELNLGADPRRADAVLEWETREANIEGVGQITQRELVRHALRFNPHWLIVGEVRDGDAAQGDVARHAARAPEPVDGPPPLGAVGVEEAGPVRRPGLGGRRVLDRRPADLRRRRLLRPPRSRPRRPSGRRRAVRGRGVERRRGAAEPHLRRRRRRPGTCPRPTSPTCAGPSSASTASTTTCCSTRTGGGRG